MGVLKDLSRQAAEAVPDLSGAILAGYRVPRRSEEPELWLRWSLVLAALVQLLVALPGMWKGGYTLAAHAARDLSAWDGAFAVGLLWAARRPARAAGLVPFAAALAAVVGVLSLLDIAAGRVPALAELPHALALFGPALLWEMTHPRATVRTGGSGRHRTA